jgi:hypothetical protein
MRRTETVVEMCGRTLNTHESVNHQRARAAHS